MLSRVDSGLGAAEAISSVLGAQIELRNNRRLKTAMRSSRLTAVKTLSDFDFGFQPSLKREQPESADGAGPGAGTPPRRLPIRQALRRIDLIFSPRMILPMGRSRLNLPSDVTFHRS